MKVAADMDVPGKEGERMERYRTEISRRIPPKTHHDAFMIKVYRRLLSSATELRSFEQARAGRIEKS